MSIVANSAVMGAAFIAGFAIGAAAAYADPLCRPDPYAAATVANGSSGSGPLGSCQSPGREVAALPPANPAAPNSVTLPEVNVFGPAPRPGYYMAPYVNAFGYKTMVEHYQVPPGYDADVALHPYTSGIGPWPGPGATMIVVRTPSHYNR